MKAVIKICPWLMVISGLLIISCRCATARLRRIKDNIVVIGTVNPDLEINDTILFTPDINLEKERYVILAIDGKDKKNNSDTTFLKNKKP